MNEARSELANSDIYEEMDLFSLLNVVLALCKHETAGALQGLALIREALELEDMNVISLKIKEALVKLCRWHDIEARRIKICIKRRLGYDPYEHVVKLSNLKKDQDAAIKSLDLDNVKNLLLRLKEKSLKPHQRNSLWISQGRDAIDQALLIEDPRQMSIAVIDILQYMKGLQGDSVEIKNQLRTIFGLSVK